MSKKESINKCKECGNYAPYSKIDGTPDTYGNCLSIALNKECNEDLLVKNPFAHDELNIVEVEAEDRACALFRIGRTKRIREFIKKHAEWYSVKRLTTSSKHPKAATL